MLERVHQQEEQNTLPLTTYTPVPNLEVQTEAEIEDYLDQAYAALIGKVSYEDRQRMRQELRVKLEGIIVAYQELGYSRQEAISLTLQPLRTEATVQENTASHFVQAEANALELSKSLAFRYFGGASLVYLVALFGSQSAIWYSDKLFMLLPFSFWLPLMTGVFLGGRARTRPVLSTLRAMGLLSLPFVLAHPFWAGLAHRHDSYANGMLLGVLNFACWTVSGTIGAAVGGRLRKYFKPGAVVKVRSNTPGEAKA
jgi:hypothetical protein